MLITRAIRMFRNIFDRYFVTKVAERIRFRVLIDRISYFHETICQISRLYASTRNMREGTSNMTRRVRCQTVFNVPFRWQTIFTLICGRSHFLTFRPICVGLRAMLLYGVVVTSSFRRAVFKRGINFRKRHYF